MAKSSAKSGLLSGVVPAVIVALLVGGTAPWWWPESSTDEPPPSGETAAVSVDPELVREAVARIVRFRQRFRLCEIDLTFVVEDQIALVDDFANDLVALDEYVSPNYDRHRFYSLISELTATPDPDLQVALSSLAEAWEQLPAEAAQLRNYLDRLCLAGHRQVIVRLSLWRCRGRSAAAGGVRRA